MDGNNPDQVTVCRYKTGRSGLITFHLWQLTVVIDGESKELSMLSLDNRGTIQQPCHKY